MALSGENGKFERTRLTQRARGKTGAILVSVEEVVQDVDILFLVLPQKAFSVLPKGLLNKAKKETIVIDVGNYYSWRDGRIDEIESGLTDSARVEKQIEPDHSSKLINGRSDARYLCCV